MAKKIKIGIDINGVLANDKILHTKTGSYSIFSVIEGAINAVKKIVKKFGAENVYIVSRVTSYQSSFITGVWMEKHNFLQKTKIPLDNIYICTQFKDKSKIAKELGVTHFIDNRFQVFKYFPKNIKLIAFQPENSDIKKYSEVSSRAIIVNSWEEIGDYFKV